MFGRLRCPATGDEDGAVFPVWLSGPKQMVVRTTSLAVLPEALVLIEVIERSRIRITVVEASHLFPYSK